MKRIRFSFFSQHQSKGWELAITDQETLQVYARQAAGFTTQQDAYLAAEVLLSAMQSIGAELATRGEWKEAPLD